MSKQDKQSNPWDEPLPEWESPDPSVWESPYREEEIPSWDEPEISWEEEGKEDG